MNNVNPAHDPADDHAAAERVAMAQGAVTMAQVAAIQAGTAVTQARAVHERTKLELERAEATLATELAYLNRLNPRAAIGG